MNPLHNTHQEHVNSSIFPKTFVDALNGGGEEKGKDKIINL